MEITMNVKVKVPEARLDGIPDFLKRAPSTDPAAPTAEVAANAIAIIEQALDLGATREDVEKAEVAADSTRALVTEPTTEETNMTKTTKKVKALKAAKAPKVPQAAKAPKAAGPHGVAAFTRAAAKGKAPKAAAAAKAPKAAKARKAAAAAKAPKVAAKAPRPGKKKAAAVIPVRREGTKQAIILSMLAKGTTVAKIMEATDWQPHTVRGFLAAVVRKKLGLTLESEKADGERVYRVIVKPEASTEPEAA